MSVDLFVTAGSNRGAYVPIGPGRHTVGASDDSDVVLEGAPANGFLVLEVDSGLVRVVPSGGAVARVDGRVLGRGGLALKVGSEIEFGETGLRVFWGGDDLGAQTEGGGSRVGWGLRAAGVLVVAVGTGIFLAEVWGGDLRQGSSSVNGAPASPKFASDISTKTGGALAKNGRPAEAVSGNVLDGVESRVKAILRGTGLSGKLEAGRLVVTGSVLTAKDEKRLENIIAELRPYLEVDVSGVRGRGGGNSVAPQSHVVASAKIVAINIVEAGPAKSYFETEGGARYFEGAVFGDGYVVSEIRPTVVSMEKGGRKVEYALTGY